MESKNNAIDSVSLGENAQQGFRYESLEATEKRNRNSGQHPHRHDYYTILWNQGSEGTHHIDFQQYDVEPQTVFLLKPGQVHHINLDDRAEGEVLAFDEDFLMKSLGGQESYRRQEIHELLATNLLHLQPEQSEPLTWLFAQIAEESQQKGPYHTDLIQAYLRAVLLLLNRQRFQTAPANREQVRKPQQISRQFMQLVEKHFRTYHEVKHYADMLHITRTHLNDTVKGVTNKSAKEIIQERLFLEAKRTAYFSDCSVKEITFELGFKNQTHFSKFFTRQAGESFMKFRKKIRSLYE